MFLNSFNFISFLSFPSFFLCCHIALLLLRDEYDTSSLLFCLCFFVAMVSLNQLMMFFSLALLLVDLSKTGFHHVLNLSLLLGVSIIRGHSIDIYILYLIALFLNYIYCFGFSVAFREYFGSSFLLFLNRYIKGMFIQLTCLLIEDVCVMFVSFLFYYGFFLPSIFSMGFSEFVLSFAIIALQSFLEEKLFRDVVHRCVKKISLKFGINIDSHVKKFLLSFCSALCFAVLHLPAFYSLPLSVYVFLLSARLCRAMVFGLIYEYELAFDSSVAMVSGMHAVRNFWLIYAQPWADSSWSHSYLYVVYFMPLPFNVLAYLIYGLRSYLLMDIYLCFNGHKSLFLQCSGYCFSLCADTFKNVTGYGGSQTERIHGSRCDKGIGYYGLFRQQ